MTIYYDSLEFYNSIRNTEREPKSEPKPTKQKDEPIISNKMLYMFGIIAVIKIAILLLWI